MMIFENFIVIIVLLYLGFYASTLLYNSYLGIRIRQKKLERTFNKELLKNAGFSSLSKRIFEFCFDLLLFWVIFYYKDGIAISKVKAIMQVILGKIIFLLPISRKALLHIDFALYSFIAVIVIAGITALICAISINLNVLGSCIIGLISFVVTWYIDLGICYFFHSVVHIGSAITLLNSILAIVCYILILAVNFFIILFINYN